MDNQEIIEGDKLIAEFMNHYWVGSAGFTYNDSLDCEELKSLQYNFDFNWLMAVVSKIEWEHGKLVRIEGFGCEITSASNENPIHKPFRVYRHKVTKIQAVWCAVVEFIEWYNKNNKL